MIKQMFGKFRDLCVATTGSLLATSKKFWRTDLGNDIYVIRCDTVSRRSIEMFQKNFRADPPDTPIHYEGRVKISGMDFVWGYVHYTECADFVLAGGLVVDSIIYRKMTPSQQDIVRNGGGLGDILMKTACSKFSNKPIFAYIGEPRSRQLNIRVGFTLVSAPHLFGKFNQPISEEVLKQVIDVGPF